MSGNVPPLPHCACIACYGKTVFMLKNLLMEFQRALYSLGHAAGSVVG